MASSLGNKDVIGPFSAKLRLIGSLQHSRITEFSDPSDEREERVKDGSTHGNRLAQNMTVILAVLTNLGEKLVL